MTASEGGYCGRVRRHFAAPVHAGDLRARYARTVAGTAAESETGCRVTLVAGLDAHIFREVRFRVFGCPHLIAAAEEWCRRIEGRPVTDARPPAVAALLEQLAVPVEKTGRLLLLEDAWAALRRDLERGPAGRGDGPAPDETAR